MSNKSISVDDHEKVNLHIVSGQYVVPKSSCEWVYDVLVKDNGTDICTVGFTKNQKEGALFFSNFNYIIKYHYEQDAIKRLAKDYALSHGVSW